MGGAVCAQFRDHIMRQTPNSAKCNRANPCVDCSRVLTCFERESDEALWKKMDENAAGEGGQRRLWRWPDGR